MIFHKIIVTTLILITIVAEAWADDPLLRPYVLSSNVQADRVKTLIEVKEALNRAGFETVGEYAPDDERYVLVVTHAYLKGLAKKDLGAIFTVPLRITFTLVEGRLQVAYNNLHFLQYAYHVNGDLSIISNLLREVLGAQTLFGTKGISQSNLSNYRYSYGMEAFADFLELEQFRDHTSALKRVEQNLSKSSGLLGKVFKIVIPGSNIAIFGVSIKGGSGGDQSISEAVDTALLKHTPRLPYTVVVRNGRVFALHPRFKLPLDFPDLKRTGDYSFTRIIKAPGAIEAALRSLVGTE